MQKEQLIEQFAKIKVANLEYINSGWDSSAYLLNGELIAKFANHPQSIAGLLTEGRILRYLKEQGFKLSPGLVFSDPQGRFIIMHKIQGELSTEADMTLPFLREVTQIIFDLAALPSADTIGLEADKRLFSRFRFLIKHLRVLSYYLRIDLLLFVIFWLFKAIFLEKHQSAKFCHNDICLDHIFLEAGKVSGIIDWADARLSDPAYELGRLLRETCNLKLIAQALESFSVDRTFIERVKAYAVLSSAEDIIDGHKAGELEYARSYANKIRKLQQSFRKTLL